MYKLGQNLLNLGCHGKCVLLTTVNSKFSNDNKKIFILPNISNWNKLDMFNEQF